MSVEKMTMVNLIGNYNILDKAIDACVSSRVFQPESTTELLSDVKAISIARVTDENPYAAPLSKLTDILKLSDIEPELIKDSEIDIDVDDIVKYTDKFKEQMDSLIANHSNIEKELASLDISIEQLQHFTSLDIPLSKVFSSQYLKVRFGRIPADSFVKLKTFTDNPYLVFVPCSSDDEFYWGVYVTPLEREDEVDEIFASLYFERLRIPDSAGTPAQALDELTARREKLQKDYESLTNEIIEFVSSEHDRCLKIYTSIKLRYNAFEIRRYCAKYNNYFMLVGWIPLKEKAKFSKIMDKVDGIEYSYDEPKKNNRVKPPTKLRNLKIFRPFEYFVSMYGLPNYGEIDPTIFVAITYTIMFGIMFADLGQGIVLAIAGFLMYKLKGMPLGKILIPCGLCGAFFGIVFGSVFGLENVLDPLYRAIGFSEKPISVMEDVTTILLFAIIFGMAMIVIAMLLNIVSNLKQKNYEKSLFGPNGFAGMAIYLTIILVAGSIMLGFSLPLLPTILIGVVLPIIIILFKEPLGNLVSHKKKLLDMSFGEYFMQSFFELFESILTFFTNTVSFIRVGAFVLVHASMMMVFTSLYDIVGGGIVGIIIMVFGNVFVTVLEGLLVGVQVLRLEFYEMFSRFYEGGGRKYASINIKNDIQQI